MSDTAELPSKFYHGSSTHLPVGEILRPRGAAYDADWSGTDFYSILEAHRPADMISHRDAVFMTGSDEDVDLAGGGTEWLMVVEPLGPVQRHDINWSSEISCLMDNPDGNAGLIRQAAEAYWAGLPHRDEQVWEYLTTSARIVTVDPYDAEEIPMAPRR